jgi:hypothetical protein
MELKYSKIGNVDFEDSIDEKYEFIKLKIKDQYCKIKLGLNILAP